MSDLALLPIPFWASFLVLLGVSRFAWLNREKGWGYPALAVIGTVIAWYHGDVLYNGYAQYANSFPDPILDQAWWQIALFGVSFGAFVFIVPRLLNKKLQGSSSVVESLLNGSMSIAALQPALKNVATGLCILWFLIFLISVWGASGDVLGVLAPYYWEPTSGLTRGQVASSIFDSLYSVIESLRVICAALAGVCAVLLRPGMPRNMMFLLVVLTWPPFLLNRTRNVMLAIALPAILSLVFLRWRRRLPLQIGFLVFAFLAANFWFKFVIANRGQATIVAAVKDSTARADVDPDEIRHLGFNMFEELCWVDYLTENSMYKPVWGMLYFANFVNPIPRAIWPGKPTMGLDYAIARGQREMDDGGTTATISTGMIGSGITNFGPLIGPVAAAFLMSLWCAFLARLDLQGRDFGYLLVYILGLVLTFNFGRDITILVAYPALFGWGVLWCWRKISPYKPPRGVSKHPSRIPAS